MSEMVVEYMFSLSLIILGRLEAAVENELNDIRGNMKYDDVSNPFHFYCSIFTDFMVMISY